MNSNDRITLKLLDEMESEMDNHDGKSYAQAVNEKNKGETKPEPAPAATPEPKKGGNFYTNPDKQRVLDEVEMQSNAMPVRGQFGRSRRA